MEHRSVFNKSRPHQSEVSKKRAKKLFLRCISKMGVGPTLSAFLVISECARISPHNDDHPQRIIARHRIQYFKR